MSKYRKQLPQLSNKTFITDGGLETSLIFHNNIEIPEFAAYDLLRSQEGYETLLDYYITYAALAQKYKQGLVLETPTWRANSDWGEKIGDSNKQLAILNAKAVQLIKSIRDDYENEDTPIVVSGCLGPRGDGYSPTSIMTASQAKTYHIAQIATFHESDVDMVAALTVNYVDEAIGITLAAQEYDMPVCISFTLETDGKLPTGESLEDAITLVDSATQNGPVYYMINCAHPSHFDHLIDASSPWLKRLKGLRCNASCLSHAELDECTELDDGNPQEFGFEFKYLKKQAPHLTVLGGCCGTDERHIEAICESVALYSDSTIHHEGAHL